MSSLDPYTAHYYFSAVFQGDATLLSVLVIFVIFKLQSMESQLQMVKERLYDDGGRSIHPRDVLRFESATKEDKEKMVPNYPSIKSLLERWIALDNQISILKRDIKCIAAPLVIVVVLSLFGVVFASSLNFYWCLIVFSVINLLVIGYTIWKTATHF